MKLFLFLVLYSVCVWSTVDISVIPSSQFVLEGVSNSINVLFEIKNGIRNRNRPSFDLCVVLDTSGSMRGGKIENAKKAIKEIIENLLPDDRLQLITYSGNSKILIEDETNKERLLSIVDNIEATGGTNLYDGLQTAFHIMKEKSSKRIKRIFLFSDGLTNLGIQDPNLIMKLVREIRSESQTTVSSFGIGADFDQFLMTNIAEEGAGDYFFLDDDKDIQKLVSKAMRGFISLLGIDSKLTLLGLNGGIVKKAFGYSNQELLNGLILGDVREGDISKILIEMEISPKKNSEILWYEFSYIPVGEKERIKLQGILKLDLTTDRSLIVQNADVLAYSKLQGLVENDEEVQKLYENGQKDEAIHKKQEIISELESKELSENREASVLLRRSRTVLRQMNDEERSTEQTVKQMLYYKALNSRCDRFKEEL